MNLNEAIQKYLLEPRSSQTEHSYEAVLRKMALFLDPKRDVRDITCDDLVAWHRDMVQQQRRYEDHPLRPPEAGGLSPHTIHKRLVTARGFWQWLFRVGEIDEVPMEGVKITLPDKPQVSARTIPFDELCKLAAVLRTRSQDWAIFCLFLDTACRAGAVATLSLSALDREHRLARLHEKGNRTHSLPYSPDTAEALEAWLAARPEVKDRSVFLNRDRKPWTPDSLRQWLYRRCDKAEIRRYSPHDLRRTASVYLALRGVPLSLIQKLLGHSDSAITVRHYLPDDNEDLRGMIENKGLLRGLFDANEEKG